MANYKWAEIELSGKHGSGKSVKVDVEDFDFLMKYKWHQGSGGYAFSLCPKLQSMHRLLMKPKKNLVVDHINHDRLDNRRENLRVCTQKENMQNKTPGKRRKNYKRKRVSVYKGKDGKTYETWVRY